MPASIKHIVVLMLENRSFDSMLGMLKQKGSDFDGLDGTETNPAAEGGDPGAVPVWESIGTDPATMTIPCPDPGELFSEDMNIQIFGKSEAADATPTMSGFVIDYAKQPSVDPSKTNAVMHYFTPEQVPVISQLALAYGVSDCWHASAPCQTWPNRFFVHTGTAGGYVNNSPVHFPYKMKSVFELLSEKKLPWRIYFHDIPQAATLANIWRSGSTNFRFFDEEFVTDALTGMLPAYSFIEPRYFASDILQLIPNDQHPPHNVQYGEQLIAKVYNAVRNGPNWNETLLIITYDEHGGCFDHVPPPPAPKPGGPEPNGFAFDRYGVRVPAIIISPYVEAGSTIRPPVGSSYPFDHTSIISTLCKVFDLAGPLTGRDGDAPDLLSALILDGPANDGPAKVAPPSLQATPEEVTTAVQAAPNYHQRALCQLAAHLPSASTDIEGHLEALAREILLPAAPILPTVEKALAFIEAKVRSFLG